MFESHVQRCWEVRMSFVRSRCALAAALWCALMCMSAIVSARERLAVIVFAPNDALLSDNLTEVAIARLAELDRHELVGMRELEANLSENDARALGGLEACVADPACLRKLGERAGVKLMLVGRAGRSESGERLLEMRLADVQTAQTVAQSTRAQASSEPQMIAAVRQCIAELFKPAPRNDEAPALGPKARPVTLDKAPPKTASTQQLAAPQRSVPVAHHRQNYVAYGAATLAILTFSAAAVTGIVASGTPQGHSRLEAQSDAERRNDYAHVTNGLLVAGAALATVSTCAFIWHW